MPENFAVIVAPLHTTEYGEAMKRLTELQAQGFKVMQRDILPLYDFQAKMDRPYCVFWLERSMMALVANPEPVASIVNL